VSNSCGIYEDIKRFLTGIMQKLKFFHSLCPRTYDCKYIDHSNVDTVTRPTFY
jgi:hypothetical protein